MKNCNNNKLKTILIIVFAVSLFISFFKIYDLSEQINQINENLIYRDQDIRNQIDSIYANVDNKLNKQASLFSNFSYEDGKFHHENNTAELIIELMPKTVTDDMTLSVTMDGKDIPLKRTGNTFKGTITVDAFKYYEEKPVVNIKTAGEIKTQVLDDIYLEYLYQNHLGSLTAHSSLSFTYSKYAVNDSKEKTVTFNGYVTSYYSNPKLSTDNIKKAYIVTELNGKEVDKTDITTKMELSEYEFCSNVSYSKSFKATDNDVIEVYAVVEDSYGYIHKYLADHHTIKDNGADTYQPEEMIFDKNGNLLTQ